jgi:hypothetical protein
MEVIKGIMKGADDIRYQSEAAATVAAERVLFPVDLSIRKPTYTAALAAARAIMAQIETEAAQLKVGSFSINAGSIRFQHEEKGTILMQITCILALTPAGEAAFWSRAEAIAATLDLVQKFCEPPAKGSADMGVYTGQAQHGSKPAGGGA